MRLYRSGDKGAPIRDIQSRVRALGYDFSPDEPGEFQDGTTKAVKEFQESRGLPTDGIVGPETWRVLYEAGYKLGDRILYLRRPMFRGDDVADLQSRLNVLGFDSGQIDGVFGPDTEAAVREFQHNRHLAEDAKVGPSVVTELAIVSRGTKGTSLADVREKLFLKLPDNLVGARVYLDAGCRSPEEAATTWKVANLAALELQNRGGVPILSRSYDASLPDRVRARRANEMGADLIVSFQSTESEGDGVFYFESPHFKSNVGEALAKAIADLTGVPTAGRATALLKETRAPAAVISRGTPSEMLGVRVINGVEKFLADQAAGVR